MVRSREGTAECSVHDNMEERLRKRTAYQVEDEAYGLWMPGAGIPLFPFGEPAEVKRQKTLMRTSLLFSELEREMHHEREAFLLARRAHEWREIRLSAELANKFPMSTDKDEAPVAAEHAAAAEVEVQCARAAARTPEQCTAEELAKKEMAGRRLPDLPAPLSQRDLEAAYAELPVGACSTIQTCVECWQSGRLTSSDVVDTVRSFASLSKMIRGLFEAAGKAALPSGLCSGEAATDEEMHDLAKMAQV